VLLVLGMYLLFMSYKVVRWKAYIWLPSYLSVRHSNNQVPNSQKHLIFVITDHYEPGLGDRGIAINREWLEAFKPIADSHKDSYGNRFRYTWFYPYDHQNEHVLKTLCHMAYDGYGEVELHWHHEPATNDTFPAMLDKAIEWFQGYGALIASGDTPSTQFAFIHGNWCLDNSHPRCGVTRELDILFDKGCYADFTFSTIGTDSQPSKVNSIYYATDSDGSKSYNDGVDAEVGSQIDDRLMIFEGPIALMMDGSFECAAVESADRPNPKRVRRWIDSDIHVRGRPEWVFVKVYSHGAQSRKEIVHADLGPMLDSLEAECRHRSISLHYMSAREAYNVVKAAEEGLSGDPEQYRDHRLSKPCNMLFRTDVPVKIERITSTEKKFVPIYYDSHENE
jgi:hypothetical protein